MKKRSLVLLILIACIGIVLAGCKDDSGGKSHQAANSVDGGETGIAAESARESAGEMTTDGSDRSFSTPVPPKTIDGGTHALEKRTGKAAARDEPGKAVDERHGNAAKTPDPDAGDGTALESAKNTAREGTKTAEATNESGFLEDRSIEERIRYKAGDEKEKIGETGGQDNQTAGGEHGTGQDQEASDSSESDSGNEPEKDEGGEQTDADSDASATPEDGAAPADHPPGIDGITFYSGFTSEFEQNVFAINADMLLLKVTAHDEDRDMQKIHIVELNEKGEATGFDYSFDLPEQAADPCFFFNREILPSNGLAGRYAYEVRIEDAKGNFSDPYTAPFELEYKEINPEAPTDQYGNLLSDNRPQAPAFDLNGIAAFSISYPEVDNTVRRPARAANADAPLEDMGEYYLLGGDIVLYKNDPRHKQIIDNILKYKDNPPAEDKTRGITWAAPNTWPGNVVHYYFCPVFTLSGDEKRAVRQAMDSLEQVCAVKFIEENDNIFVPRYKIFKGIGEVKYAGMSTLGWSIFGGWYDFRSSHMKTIIHELCHCLGMHHEHQRPDRDNYIRIVENNIDFALLNQFWKIYGTKSHGNYDIKSIMHYSQRAGTKYPDDFDKYTIEAKDPEEQYYLEYWYKVGVPGFLSEGDKQTLRALYSGEAHGYWKDVPHQHWVYGPFNIPWLEGRIVNVPHTCTRWVTVGKELKWVWSAQYHDCDAIGYGHWENRVIGYVKVWHWWWEKRCNPWWCWDQIVGQWVDDKNQPIVMPVWVKAKNVINCGIWGPPHSIWKQEMVDKRELRTFHNETNCGMTGPPHQMKQFYWGEITIVGWHLENVPAGCGRRFWPHQIWVP